MLRPSSSTTSISVESLTRDPSAAMKSKSASAPGLAFASISAEIASSSRRKLRSIASDVSSRCAALSASRAKVASSSAGVRYGLPSAFMRAAAAFRVLVSSGVGMVGLSVPM